MDAGPAKRDDPSVFDSLGDKLTAVFRKVTGKGKLTDENVKEALRDVRMALLEADVHFKVAKTFVQRVKDKALGSEVHLKLNPGQQFIKIVHEELIEIMGKEAEPIRMSSQPPTVIMMVGLQGSGKTTTLGKLAAHLRKTRKKSIQMVACDVYRPAAIDQLETIGRQLGISVHADRSTKDVVAIARAALVAADAENHDVIIVDTAGRLHIDAEMMDELEHLRAAIKPDEILLVVDAMTGQDAVRVAEEFNARLDVTGVVLTKLDGDARGGAALSVREVTGKPIKFVGMGEKLDALQAFHPERMASRILGMGDVLSLIDKVETSFDQKQMKQMQNRLLSDEFNLQDYLDQLKAVKKMGSLGDLLKMVPGFSQLAKMPDVDLDEGEKQLKRAEAIISSMTKGERSHPRLLGGSRRKRVATGSGTSVQEVNQLLKQFAQTKKMMKQFKGMASGKKPRGFKMPFMR